MKSFDYAIKINNTSLIKDYTDYVDQVSIFECKLGYIVNISLTDYITYHYSGSNGDGSMIEGFSFKNSGVEVDFNLPILKEDQTYHRFINWDKKGVEILYVPSKNLYKKQLSLFELQKDN
jgi:hypothetical protein